MTRPINEEPLHRREGTEGAHVPQGPPSRGRGQVAPLPPQVTRVPTCFPHPGPLSAWPRLSSAESELAHLARRSPRSPRILRGREGGRQAIGAHRAGSSAARAYLAKSRATPEQLRVPAGSRALFAHSRPESENTQQALPRGGERNSLGICLVITGHKALGVFATSVPQPTRQGWGWGEGRV